MWFTALAQNHLSLEIKSFERHAAIGWNHSGEAATYFQIFTAEEGEDFKEVFKSTSDSYLHFTDANTLENYRIYVRALNGLSQPAVSDTVTVVEEKMTDAALVDMVQEAHFRYFGILHPSSGMARERNTSGDVVTTGGTGFGIMAILVGIENGYISRSPRIATID